MKFGVCITTRNRPEQLLYCLNAVWLQARKPEYVVVSDDSDSLDMISKNKEILQGFQNSQYLIGPQMGVCANRNNALTCILEKDVEFVAFVDDDIQVHQDYLRNAESFLDTVVPEKQRESTILTGMIMNSEGESNTHPVKLSFRGYFQQTDLPEAVCSPTAIYPVKFLMQERWDENIFFGYEDAELCLRAIRLSYQITYCPDLRVADAGQPSILKTDSPTAKIGQHELHVEAARLYVGVKRFKLIFPSHLKLIIFLAVYFSHMSIYLIRKNSLEDLPKIFQASRISTFF
jgi:GT2 family glycosyltransferase